jgi:hypothetical protein
MNLALYVTGAATLVIGVFPNIFILAVDWSVANLGPSGIALLK